ncbi:MAG: peptidoglycan -binding protein [Alphaproteobacteria bacterium]|nr:peptidoglycan -binding protein [Alphaproteobacteria bacterium]
MADYAARRGGRASINVWPGWVDALATLVMVVMFLLMVFVVAQFYLREALSGREKTLKTLSGQISEIADLLSMERQSNADLRANFAQLSAELKASIADRDDLSNRLGQLTQRLEKTETEAWKNAQALTEANKTVQANRETIEVQVRQLLALQAARDQLQQRLAEEAAKLKQAESGSADLTRQLGETTKSAEAAQQRIDQLAKEIAGLQELKTRLEAEVKDRDAAAQAAAKTADERAKELEQRLAEGQKALDTEKAGSAQARDELALLNRQIAALRDQIGKISAALELSEAKGKDQEAQIADLGKRLNVALASKVQELARYRSEFFGRLRELLGERQDIRVVGDRFVFQSEVLFESGSADIGAEGRAQLADLATALKDIAKNIPPEINWILRVDGHTDKQPIARLYKSNWELSFARALAVVRFLIAQGIPAERLAATGFGEFQPIDEREDEIGRRRNRRIELKFDQR